jgi:hypothetical protein
MQHRFFLALSLLVLSACGGPLKYEMRGSQLSPGSDAKLVAKVDDKRNVTHVELNATNLTPPDRVLPGATAYVVWSRKNSEVPWSRVGALELDDDGRKGEANLTVSESAFDLLISAEKTVAVAAPSGRAVFEQRVQEE